MSYGASSCKRDIVMSVKLYSLVNQCDMIPYIQKL